jgi:hypothetical protein
MACISRLAISAYIGKDNLFIKDYESNKPVCIKRTFVQSADATAGCRCRMDDCVFIELISNGTPLGIG